MRVNVDLAKFKSHELVNLIGIALSSDDAVTFELTDAEFERTLRMAPKWVVRELTNLRKEENNYAVNSV